MCFFEGGTNKRPGTDHVISGPMRGLGKKTAPNGADKQTSGHGGSMTESAQWGRFSENAIYNFYGKLFFSLF